MTGFPKTPKRAAFGPTYRDEPGFDVQDPETELGADSVNLLCWQVAGAGRTVPRAVLLITGGSTPAVVYQAIVWDPDGKLSYLTVTRTGAGQYSITFSATYRDEADANVSWQPTAALPTVQGAAAGTDAVATVTGQVVAIKIRDASATLVDASIFLMVW